MANQIIPDIKEGKIDSIILSLCHRYCEVYPKLVYDKYNIDSIKIDQSMSGISDNGYIIDIEIFGINLDLDNYLINYIHDGKYYFKPPYIELKTNSHLIILDFLGIFDFNIQNSKEWDISTIAHKVIVEEIKTPAKVNRWTKIASNLGR